MSKFKVGDVIKDKKTGKLSRIVDVDDNPYDRGYAFESASSFRKIWMDKDYIEKNNILVKDLK